MAKAMGLLGYSQDEALDSDVLAIEAALKAKDTYDTFQHKIMCFAGGKPLPYDEPKTTVRKRVGQAILASAHDHNALFAAMKKSRPN